MISTVWRITALNLCRDRVALLLTFVLPIVFFSVFAAVFSGTDMQDPSDQPLKIAIYAPNPSNDTQGLIEHLMANADAFIVDDVREPARLLQTKADVIVDLRAYRLPSVQSEASTVGISSKPGIPHARPMAEGLIQAATIERLVSPMLPAETGGKPVSLVHFETLAAGENEANRPSISFFAAGLGVLFLLFSVSGRSAILIEERETGVLSRLLCSELGLGRLLIGRWLFLTMLGFLQVSLMFTWASILFGLPLWIPHRLLAFATLTVFSAAGAAALGVLLGVSCRTRAQLNGIASVLILCMSAIGGSMFPRFLMPEGLQKVGAFTFNAWAVGGYQKIFWYDARAWALLPEFLVIGTSALVLMVAAFRVASRNALP